MITVLLAEDHIVVRQGLRKVLETTPDISVIGEVTSGLEVADRVEALKPTVLLLDLGLPGLHGLEVARQVSRRSPLTHVLVLSMHVNDEYVIGAFRHGAAGYLLKGCDSDELVEAVRRVASGAPYVSPTISNHVVRSMLTDAAADVADPYAALSVREREVFQLMAEGHSNGAIAEKLFISSRTVETHRANALRKLGLHSQTDVVRYALRKGILPPDGL